MKLSINNYLVILNGVVNDSTKNHCTILLSH